MTQVSADNELYSHGTFQAYKGQGGILNDLSNNTGTTVHVALMTSNYTPDRFADNVWSDISADEVSDTSQGYSTEGKEITTKSLSENDTAPPTVVFDGDDVVWSNSTITARYAVYFDNTGTDDTQKPLLGVLDFGQELESDDGEFRITWDSNGIFEASMEASA